MTIKEIKERLTIFKAERLIKRNLNKIQNYDTFIELSEKLEEIKAQKAEIKAFKKRLLIATLKNFYINYFLSFVFFDNGQMYQRGRLFEMFILWARLNICIFWARLTGYSVNHKYLKSHFVLYTGVKMASRKTGYTEEILIKPTSEVLRGAE